MRTRDSDPSGNGRSITGMGDRGDGSAMSGPFRFLADVSDDIFWVMNADTRAVVYVSRAYERIWYRSRADLLRQGGDFHALADEADSGHLQEALGAVLSYGTPLDIKYRMRDGRGRVRWAHDRAWPYRAEGGPISFIVGITRDVTREKISEEHQNLLLREMNHRVKNTLATVISIAHQSASSAQSLEDFLETFYARVHAFSGAHDLLMQNAWTSVPLREVIARTLAHYLQRDGRRIRMDGPTVLLPHGPSVALNLVFHELATNAAKYGALSRPSGKVCVVWSVETSGGEGMLDIRWEETGGPPVKSPPVRGFGSKLIKRTLAALGGHAEVNFAPEGFDCWIALPISASGEMSHFA